MAEDKQKQSDEQLKDEQLDEVSGGFKRWPDSYPFK